MALSAAGVLAFELIKLGINAAEAAAADDEVGARAHLTAAGVRVVAAEAGWNAAAQPGDDEGS